MKTDIEIAQEAEMLPIKEVAQRVGLQEDDLELYGKYKAKISNEYYESIKDNEDGKLILVTAINPTPAGEGKTTVTVGLGEAFGRLNKKAVIALREPSLGPCFGIKGGAAGGGYAQVVPMEDLNLHFTGDFHAITSANNLLAAMLDNSIQQGNELNIDPNQVVWKRCVDINDRVLRNIVVGLGRKVDGTVREDHFVITVASEIMAILCLATDYADLKERLGKIIVAYTYDGEPVTAKDIKAVGSMAVLLKDAMKPNLIQTLEHTPALVHGGPFANIAHGCNSVKATKTALKMADYVITEAGFGADLGAEKFLDIKCRKAGLKPDCVVLVATVRALKYNGGVAKEDLSEENLDALAKGIVNLEKHIENLQKFGVPVVVTLNQFITDTEAEYEYIKNFCEDKAVNGILVQLPLPKHIDESKVLLAIDSNKDVDGFHPVNVGKMVIGEETFLPCTPAGIIEMLKRTDVEISGKECVVIGRSNIVGKPMSMLMLKENATVTIAHSRTKDLKEVTKRADILIAAIGKAKFVTADYVKEGAVIIDVGMDRDENCKLCGDVDFDSVSQVASAITPVPGGVGPMTVTMLLVNCLRSVELNK